MPDPQNLPRVAATVIQENAKWDREDVDAFIKIAFAAARGDMDTVQDIAEQGAQRNMDAVESQQFLLSKQPGKAQDTVMDANIRNRKLREVPKQAKEQAS